MPWEIETITKDTISQFDATTFGIHCHNDCGLAVANSLMAVQAGAGLIQGTVNGIGERTGNADLVSIVPSLALHCETETMTCKDNLASITSLSRFLDETLVAFAEDEIRSRLTDFAPQDLAKAAWSLSVLKCTKTLPLIVRGKEQPGSIDESVRRAVACASRRRWKWWWRSRSRWSRRWQGARRWRTAGRAAVSCSLGGAAYTCTRSEASQC